jgi:hypothetical protein
VYSRAANLKKLQKNDIKAQLQAILASTNLIKNSVLLLEEEVKVLMVCLTLYVALFSRVSYLFFFF